MNLGAREKSSDGSGIQRRRPAIVLARAAASNVGLADCNGTPTATGYYSTATPVTAGNTGQRAFATTGNGTIFFDSNGTAPTEAAIAPGGGASPIQ